MVISSTIEKIQFITKCSIECENLFFDYIDNKLKINLAQYERDLFYNELSFHCFDQLWSNTGCGWVKNGSIVGQAFSYSKNFIAISKRYLIAFVFLDRYAYTCKVDENFNEVLIKQQFPGVYEESKLEKI